jgi:hypothetical protein
MKARRGGLGRLAGALSPQVLSSDVCADLGLFHHGSEHVARTKANCARDEGPHGVRVPLRPMMQWQVGWRWYLLAVAYMPALKLSVGACLAPDDRRVAALWHGQLVHHRTADHNLNSRARRGRNRLARLGAASVGRFEATFTVPVSVMTNAEMRKRRWPLLPETNCRCAC